jgi:predicted nucleic acid-binding protein
VIVADTTVLVDALRGRPAAAAAIDAAFDRGEELTGSVVSKVEIWRGLRAHGKRTVRALFELIQWVPVDEAVADLAGEYARIYRASHQGIDVPDLIVAATAMRADAELWTRNVKHFPMFEALEAPY